MITSMLRCVAKRVQSLRAHWHESRVSMPMSLRTNSRNANPVRIHRWGWICLLLSLLVLKSFFVRQLLAAFLLFAVLFLVAGTVMMLFLTLDYVIDFSLGWMVSELRSTFSLVSHHPMALPARVQPSGRRLVSYRKH